MTDAVPTTLQDLVEQHPDLVSYFFNDTRAPHSRTSTGLSAPFIPAEVTNWRDEQRSWRESAVLFNQSHHMPELFLEGPDALKLLERVAINSFTNFTPDRAKQMVVCNPDGYVIGDCVLYNLGDAKYELVSGMSALDWVEYQASSGGYDVTIRRDASSPFNDSGRREKYRFQVDGPAAGAILDEVVEGGMPELPFFRTTRVRIAGCEVLVLRHGMAGHNGAELSGPYEQIETIRGALLAAGEKHGILQAGTRAYFSTVYESGWMAYPIPAIYTGEAMRGFREWLAADSWEANTQLGGSLVLPRIEDYYLRPWELGYDRILKFDHDFIGREALEAIADQPRRGRVTLVWDHDDGTRVFASQLGAGPRYKALDFPVVDYGFPQVDAVHDADGAPIGFSSHCGYSANEGEMLSLAILDAEHTTPGATVTITWGEADGGSRKAQVEKHEQTTIRATVAPVPYPTAVQRMKRDSIKAGR